MPKRSLFSFIREKIASSWAWRVLYQIKTKLEEGFGYKKPVRDRPLYGQTSPNESEKITKRNMQLTTDVDVNHLSVSPLTYFGQTYGWTISDSPQYFVKRAQVGTNRDMLHVTRKKSDIRFWKTYLVESLSENPQFQNFVLLLYKWGRQGWTGCRHCSSYLAQWVVSLIVPRFQHWQIFCHASQLRFCDSQWAPAHIFSHDNIKSPN